MASLLIRRLDEALKDALKARAMAHGRSMEAEARAIIAKELERSSREAGDPRKASEVIRYAMRRSGGVDLDIPDHGRHRDFPDFSGPDFSPPGVSED